MLRLGHYGAAMLAYVPVVRVLGPHRRWLAIGGLLLTLLASRLPDLDQRIPFLPHRGPTHTIWFALAVGCAGVAALDAVATIDDLVVLALAAGTPFLGVGSHLVADAITPAGIRPFWPVWSRSVAVGLVRAENGIANQVLFLAGLIGIATSMGGAGGALGQFI